MKNTFVIILFLSLLSAQENNPLDWFPHSVGDYWEYSVNNGLFKQRIFKDSVDSEGNVFLFYDNGQNTPQVNNPDYEISNDNYVIYSPLHWSEYKYKLDAEISEEWWVYKYEETSYRGAVYDKYPCIGDCKLFCVNGKIS